jgi:hypothetical protein
MPKHNGLLTTLLSGADHIAQLENAATLTGYINAEGFHYYSAIEHAARRVTAHIGNQHHAGPRLNFFYTPEQVEISGLQAEDYDSAKLIEGAIRQCLVFATDRDIPAVYGNFYRKQFLPNIEQAFKAQGFSINTKSTSREVRLQLPATKQNWIKHRTAIIADMFTIDDMQLRIERTTSASYSYLYKLKHKQHIIAAFSLLLDDRAAFMEVESIMPAYNREDYTFPLFMQAIIGAINRKASIFYLRRNSSDTLIVPFVDVVRKLGKLKEENEKIGLLLQ